MSPIVILIRHAQALHNVNNKYLIKLCHRGHTDVSAQNYKIHDPPLSELGVSQCRDLEACLQEHLPVAQKTGLIVVSPMRRTLQTASIGLRWLIDRGTPVQLRGEWQENSHEPCDTGTKASTLSNEFPEFDFSTVFPEYPSKTGRWAFSQAAITQRGIDCRRWLKTRPEAVIVVVSHSGFLRVGVSHRHYANADYRVFRFAEGSGDELVEWRITEENGGGMGTSRTGLALTEPTEFPQEREEHPQQRPARAPREITKGRCPNDHDSRSDGRTTFDDLFRNNR